MSGYTKGPWRYEQISTKVYMGDVYAPGNTRVATNVHAVNARLIAAAPDLVEVCLRVLQHLPSDSSLPGGKYVRGQSEHVDAAHDLRAALKKAGVDL